MEVEELALVCWPVHKECSEYLITCFLTVFSIQVEGLELESDNLALTLQALEADAALLRQIVGAKAHVSVSVT